MVKEYNAQGIETTAWALALFKYTRVQQWALYQPISYIKNYIQISVTKLNFKQVFCRWKRSVNRTRA